MREYGTRNYSQSVYGFTDPVLPVTVPIQIFVYDIIGNMKRMYQSSSTDILSLSFKHTEKGCGDFTISFSSFVDILKGDRIKIKIFSSPDWFFFGVVRTVPIRGSSSRQYQYTGYGLNDYLTRISGEALSYANKTIEYIILDLLDDIITVKTPILKSTDNLSFPSITIVSLVSNYAQIPDVLDAVKKICDSTGDTYVYGVDVNGYFFFRPRSAELKQTLITGKEGTLGIPAYEPEDAEEPRTKLFVLRDDSTFYASYSSTEDNDIYEEKIKGPDISDTDLNLWALGILAQKERNTRTASIEWQIEGYEPMLLVADGTIRVISNVPPLQQITITGVEFGEGLFGDGLFGGGEVYQGFDIDDILEVREVEYAISANDAKRKITLGSMPLKLSSFIAAINQRITDLEISLGG